MGNIKVHFVMFRLSKQPPSVNTYSYNRKLQTYMAVAFPKNTTTSRVQKLFIHFPKITLKQKQMCQLFRSSVTEVKPLQRHYAVHFIWVFHFICTCITYFLSFHGVFANHVWVIAVFEESCSKEVQRNINSNSVEAT